MATICRVTFMLLPPKPVPSGIIPVVLFMRNLSVIVCSRYELKNHTYIRSNIVKIGKAQSELSPSICTNTTGPSLKNGWQQ